MPPVYRLLAACVVAVLARAFLPTLPYGWIAVSRRFPRTVYLCPQRHQRRLPHRLYRSSAAAVLPAAWIAIPFCLHTQRRLLNALLPPNSPNARLTRRLFSELPFVTLLVLPIPWVPCCRDRLTAPPP